MAARRAALQRQAGSAVIDRQPAGYRATLSFGWQQPAVALGAGGKCGEAERDPRELRRQQRSGLPGPARCAGACLCVAEARRIGPGSIPVRGVLRPDDGARGPVSAATRMPEMLEYSTVRDDLDVLAGRPLPRAWGSVGCRLSTRGRSAGSSMRRHPGSWSPISASAGRRPNISIPNWNVTGGKAGRASGRQVKII